MSVQAIPGLRNRSSHHTRRTDRRWHLPPGGLDQGLLLAVGILLVLGVVMVGSASTSIAERQTGEAFYYLWRQLVYLGIGLAAATAVYFLPLRLWQAAGPWLILVSILMLLMVFIPGLGREVNGSLRWLRLGPVNVQVSEFVKLFVILYLAGYLVRHREAVQTSMGGFLRPLALLLILAVLLLLQPDYGAVAVMLLTAMGMMWLGGARLFQFLLLLLSVSGALAVLALISPYRLERLTGFLNPWADPFDSGFQLTQALIAFGRGEWFGVGLGASVQKLFYLPEAHTDFLFAVLAEELGLVTVLLVIGLFVFIVVRALAMGRRAETRELPYHAFVAYGIGFWIGLQAFINLGVNMGVLPTKGLTLPLMSYGGSSLVVMCVAVALLLRVDAETRQNDRRTQREKKTW
jgi:cell division protein FtsW